MAPASQAQEVSWKELIELASQDSDLFNRTFFKDAFRMKTPAFHRDIFALLDSHDRQVAIEVFRGGAKTTILRAYTAKRIAYGLSRTILFVSLSQAIAEDSINWLRQQIEFNKWLSQAYGLSKSKDKWTSEEIEIRHHALDHPITVKALGITGQIRGINKAGFRPDLIVVDDPCNEENTATPEQRKKIDDLFFGALLQSLVPATENPTAKQVLLQTSLNGEDLINGCHKSTDWKTAKCPILDQNEQSVWPERFPTEAVLKERQGYADRGQLPLWMREKMCTIIGEGTCDFRPEWLQYWDVLPQRMPMFMGIDPVPPPTERAETFGYRDNDYEVLSVVGVHDGNYYLVDYADSRGHQPEWTITKFFEFVDRYRPLKVRVEGVNYQRTLKWILENKMRELGRYVQIDIADDKRKKRHRIQQAFNGIGSQRRFYIHRSHLGFTQQFIAYPNSSHDDILDATAFALDAAQGFGDGFGNSYFDLPEMKPLPVWRHAP